MTIGHTVDDFQTLQPVNSIDPCTGVVNTNLPPRLVGLRVEKTWSGSDSTSPPTVLSGNRTIFKKVWASYDALLQNGEVGHVRKKERVVRHERRKFRVERQEHPYTCSWSKRRDGFYTFVEACRYRPSQTVNQLWPFDSGVTGTDPWGPNDDIRLLSKLQEKIAGVDWNAGVAGSQVGQAASMIRESATTIYHMIQQVRRGDMYGAWKTVMRAKVPKGTALRAPPKERVLPTPEAMASAYLELQFGWKPLIQDAYDGATMLAAYLSDCMVSRTVRAQLTRKIPVRHPSPTLWAWSSAVGYHREQWVAKLTAVDPASLAGLKDPAGIAWELLPFSFVADWFVPIGNYLQALNLSRSVTGTFVKSRKVYRAGAAPVWVGTKNGVKYISNVVVPPEIHWIQGEFQRSIHASLSVPLPQMKAPEKIASVTHALEAVSLVIQSASASSRRVR